MKILWTGFIVTSLSLIPSASRAEKALSCYYFIGNTYEI